MPSGEAGQFKCSCTGGAESQPAGSSSSGQAQRCVEMRRVVGGAVALCLERAQYSVGFNMCWRISHSVTVAPTNVSRAFPPLCCR